MRLSGVGGIGVKRGGSALFTVLVVIAVASMLSAVVLTAGDSTATATDRQVERLTLRAVAWSGVQAAMAELASQRAADQATSQATDDEADD